MSSKKSKKLKKSNKSKQSEKSKIFKKSEKSESANNFQHSFESDSEYDLSNFSKHENLYEKKYSVQYPPQDRKLSNRAVEYLPLMKKEEFTERPYAKVYWPKEKIPKTKKGWHEIPNIKKGAIHLFSTSLPKITVNNYSIGLSTTNEIFDALVLYSIKESQRHQILVYPTFQDETENQVKVEVIKRYAQPEPLHYSWALIYEHAPGEYFLYVPPSSTEFRHNTTKPLETLDFRCQSYKHNVNIKCLSSITISKTQYDNLREGEMIDANIKVGPHINKCCLNKGTKYMSRDLNRTLNDDLLKEDPILKKN